ncbi:MAG: hypothetical protein F6J93_04820 [Oscillatoria sp. SIO1A7]|nr:hypothetical protein [Oscillatoria sp. SIO1A7]
MPAPAASVGLGRARGNPTGFMEQLLGFDRDLRNDTIYRGNHGGIAPTNTRYGQASVGSISISYLAA